MYSFIISSYTFNICLGISVKYNSTPFFIFQNSKRENNCFLPLQVSSVLLSKTLEEGQVSLFVWQSLMTDSFPIQS